MGGWNAWLLAGVFKPSDGFIVWWMTIILYSSLFPLSLSLSPGSAFFILCVCFGFSFCRFRFHLSFLFSRENLGPSYHINLASVFYV
jgi:hypothetical protein